MDCGDVVVLLYSYFFNNYGIHQLLLVIVCGFEGNQTEQGANSVTKLVPGRINF